MPATRSLDDDDFLAWYERLRQRHCPHPPALTPVPTKVRPPQARPPQARAPRPCLKLTCPECEDGGNCQC